MPDDSSTSFVPDSALVDIVLPLEQSEDRAVWRKAIAARLELPGERIGELRLRKHSIDARQRQIKVQLRVEVGIDGPLPGEKPPEATIDPVPDTAPQVLIVGCGPAGLFAARRCLQLGMRPILLERGKDASARRFDLRPILKEGSVLEDSNYCFGEGGAGTFSDGKLYTRATKRGPVREIYETFVAHGAPERILIDAHPHIGSNLLPRVVMAMRASILAANGEVHFNARVTELQIEDKRVRGLRTADGREFQADRVILATGHSARDIYEILDHQGIRLEAKAFAVGVRIEHPQSLIDSLIYHIPRNEERSRLLPAASYRLATKVDGRGVHSFCMCPGGFIVPAATANDEVVVNGMSLSRRDSPFANSGMVVGVEPEDLKAFHAEHGVLGGIAFQKALERAAKEHGGGGQVAPAQRLTDFMRGRGSSDLPASSYVPGLAKARLDEILPPWIVHRLRSGLKVFSAQLKGYLTNESVLIGFETRTSSPVRIPRNPVSLQHPDVAGLFPCGEGAGFAGGIVSAALDGLACAEATARSLAR